MTIVPDTDLVGNPLALTALQDGAGIPIAVLHNGTPRTSGFAMPDGVWYRKVERSRHFLRHPEPSISSAKAALAEARRLGCTACKVVDAESGDTFYATFETIERYGRPIHQPGWEPQTALPLDRWHIIRRDGTQIPPVHERQTAPAAELQLALFGGAA